MSWTPNGMYIRNPDDPVSWWDADLDRMSKAALARFAEALIRCSAKLTCSMVISYSVELRSCSAFTRIELPDAAREKFEEISGIKLKEPPKLAVGRLPRRPEGGAS